jgi:translocation and assembly module TamB
MIVRSLVHIIFLLALTSIISLNTNLGLVILIHALPGKASVEKVSGSLLQGCKIKNLNYHYKGTSLIIKEFTLTWQWKDLLKQKLTINNVSISNVTINEIAISSNSKHHEITHINLPIDIYLNKFLLENVNIYYKNKNYLVKSFYFSGNIINNVLNIRKASAQTPDFITSGYGKINLSTWKDIDFSHTLTFLSHDNLPIVTTVIGDNDNLSLHTKSTKWLDANINLSHYLQNAKDISIEAQWFVDTTQAGFSELKQLDGKLQLSGQASGNILRPTISGNIFVKNINYDTIIVKKLNSHFNVTFDDKEKINFTLFGESISLGETVFSKISASIIGTIKSHVIKLALHIFDNEFLTFSTQASFDGKNSYYFKQSYCNLIPLNITLHSIDFHAHLKPEKKLSYYLELQQASEKLSLAAETKLNFSDFSTQLSLSSKRFTIINTPTYKIIIRPNLQLSYSDVSTTLNGTLDVLDANIEPTDFSSTITVSNDIVYVNNQGQPLYKKSAPLQWFMDIVLKINQVKINYKGVQADITGQVKLTQKPKTELNAYGQFKILKGTYKAYGQALTIQPGSTLNFNRAIDNPQLNIMANKNISVSPAYMILPSYQPHLIAGVQITGTADSPNIHLYSDPTGVSQQDILSYLIFGYPQNQLTNSQASALWNAFNMMGSGQGDFNLSILQKTIQHELGFSEFGLGSTSEYNATRGQYESGTAFVVGKRITDNLTATYNVGLLVPVNVLYLRYQLSENWLLQSDSSALGNGGDIFYTIRRD